MKPSGNTLITLFALMLLAAFLPLFDSALALWKMLASVSAGIFCIDFYIGRRSPDLEFRRKVRHSLPVGLWSKVELAFRNPGRGSVTIRVHDHYPADCRAEGQPCEYVVPAGTGKKVAYRIYPLVKGDMNFTGTDLLILSPLRFWWKKVHIEREDPIKVFPNFREIKKYTLLATDNRLSRIGIIRKQRRGEGNDFHQLRDYRAGDSFRRIDWNKTSRYLKLISKEYQDEKDQQILFLIDCGRRMRHRDETETHFDQVLNAMLFLSYVAVRQDDAVGFMTFGGISKWFPPKKNAKTIQHILDQTYNIHPTSEAADYLSAAKNVAGLQKRRSLVIILTNTRDEDTEDLMAAVAVLKKKHLVVLADLREKILDQTMGNDICSLDSAILFNSVSAYLENRRKNHKSLNNQGIITLNILPEKLPAALVNEYLMIKATGRL